MVYKAVLSVSVSVCLLFSTLTAELFDSGTWKLVGQLTYISRNNKFMQIQSNATHYQVVTRSPQCTCTRGGAGGTWTLRRFHLHRFELESANVGIIETKNYFFHNNQVTYEYTYDLHLKTYKRKTSDTTKHFFHNNQSTHIRTSGVNNLYTSHVKSTVPCEKIEPLFFLDYSANVYSRRTMLHTKSPVWAFRNGFLFLTPLVLRCWVKNRFSMEVS